MTYADAMLTLPDGTALYLIRADNRGGFRQHKRRTMQPRDFVVRKELDRAYDEDEYQGTLVMARRDSDERQAA